MSEVKRLSGIAVVGCSGRTLIKCHHYVSAYRTLYIHHPFRCEEMFRTVDVRPEPRPFFCQLAVGRQRKHLKASAVGKNRALPAVELVETSGFFKNLDSGTEIEMIGVSKDNLSLDIIAEFMLMNRLHTSESADRHENRSPDFSVVCGDDTGAGCGVRRGRF